VVVVDEDMTVGREAATILSVSELFPKRLKG
jgi:hypothetical protein